jgi:hypothetical protein
VTSGTHHIATGLFTSFRSCDAGALARQGISRIPAMRIASSGLLRSVPSIAERALSVLQRAERQPDSAPAWNQRTCITRPDQEAGPFGRLGPIENLMASRSVRRSGRTMSASACERTASATALSTSRRPPQLAAPRERALHHRPVLTPRDRERIAHEELEAQPRKLPGEIGRNGMARRIRRAAATSTSREKKTPGDRCVGREVPP